MAGNVSICLCLVGLIVTVKVPGVTLHQRRPGSSAVSLSLVQVLNECGSCCNKQFDQRSASTMQIGSGWDGTANWNYLTFYFLIPCYFLFVPPSLQLFLPYNVSQLSQRAVFSSITLITADIPVGTMSARI